MTRHFFFTPISDIINARYILRCTVQCNELIPPFLPFCCRTVPQADQLSRITPIDLALNLSLREEVLVEKCMGRRMCSHCGANYNIADIYLPAQGGRPEIIMPPLSPPAECEPHLETRADDTEEVIRKRLQVIRGVQKADARFAWVAFFLRVHYYHSFVSYVTFVW
jgi:hypothetical protein